MAIINVLTFFLLAIATESQPQVDFSCYYTAASILKAHGNVFDLQTQLAEERRLTSVQSLPFLHLPYELSLVVPLVTLGYRAALGVWRTIGLSFLAAAYCLLPKQRTLLVIAGFFPIFVCIYQGQDSFLSLLIFAGSYRLLRRGRDFEAGAVLGLAVYKPHLILPVVAIFLLRGNWRFFTGVTLVSLALLAASTAMVGPEGMRGLYNMIQTSQTSSLDLGVHPAMMPNIRGFVATMTRTNTGLLSGISSLFLFLGVFWVTRRKYSSTDVFAVSVCCVILCSFNINIHDLVLLLIPMFHESMNLSILALTFSPLQLLLVYMNLYSLLSVLVFWLLFAKLYHTKEAKPIPPHNCATQDSA